MCVARPLLLLGQLADLFFESVRLHFVADDFAVAIEEEQVGQAKDAVVGGEGAVDAGARIMQVFDEQWRRALQKVRLARPSRRD